MEKEILEELKKINLAISYQTKLLEEIFMKKDESKVAMHEKQIMLKNFIQTFSDQLQSKGIKTDPLNKIVDSLSVMTGDKKNEHQIP